MIESEQNLIGAIILDPFRLDDIVGIVSADDFEHQTHAELFSAILRLSAMDEPIDVFSVANEAEKGSMLKNQIAYVGTIASNTGSAANIEHYAKAVRDRSLNRQLSSAATAILADTKNRGDVKEKLDKAQTRIMSLNERNTEQTVKSIMEILPMFIDDLDAKHNRGGEISGKSTGFEGLDGMIDGMHDGELIIIAGRPGMGKSTLAVNIAEHVSYTEPVLIFTLEMPSDQVVSRITSAQGRVNYGAIRSAKLNDEDWTKLTVSVGKMRDMKLYFDDSAGITVNEIRAKSRQIKRKHGLGLIVIDYLQLMSGTGQNRNDVISEISRSLKVLAKELKIPIIALSQLNRGLEQRADKRPIMSDLRESGAIEQDADVIIFIYRDEMHKPESIAKGMAEIIIGKQRSGPLGTVNMLFKGHNCRFESYDGQIPGEPTQTYSRGFK